MDKSRKLGIVYEGKIFIQVGPMTHHLFRGTDNAAANEWLKDYHGLADCTAPRTLREEFRKYIDEKYPFDQRAVFLDFEDFKEEGKEAIATDIYTFVGDMNRYFKRPAVDRKYYPHGVEVTLKQVTDYIRKNNLKV